MIEDYGSENREEPIFVRYKRLQIHRSIRINSKSQIASQYYVTLSYNSTLAEQHHVKNCIYLQTLNVKFEHKKRTPNRKNCSEKELGRF
jgi:hypothetical protein